MGVALRVLQEGNHVSFWSVDPVAKSVGKGLLDTPDKMSIGPGDLVVFDMTGLGWLADMLRWQGYRVIGGSKIMDRMEEDRRYAFEIMEQCGIRTPEYQSFNSWKDGLEFAASFGDKAVFKPSGDLAENCSSMVCDKGQLAEEIEMLSKQFPDGSQYEIQEYVKGIDISTEGWFNGKTWVEPFNHTLETKKFMDGDLGPSEGCTGNIVWATPSEDPLVQSLLFPLTPFLQEHHYVGPIDVNAIMTEDGPYALEFTPRFGYDAFPTLAYELLDGDVGGFLNLVEQGDVSYSLVKDGIAAGLRLSIPPWPNQEHHAPEGIKLGGIRDWSHFCPMNVRLGKDIDLESAGAWGIIGILTGYGKNPEQAFEQPYKMAEKIKLSQKQFRHDLPEYFTSRFRKVSREVAV